MWTHLLGCAPVGGPPPAAVQHGSAQVLGSLQQAAAAGRVTEVRLTLSAEDMPSRVVPLVNEDGQWGGIIGQIPAGPNRTFSAVALDASGTRLFEGEATGITILADQTVVVVLTLQELNPPPPFGNSVPAITSLIASPSTVAPGGSVSLVATAEDEDAGDTLTYEWTAPSGSFGSPGSLSTTWTAPSSTGPVPLTLTVTDSQGSSAAVSLTITVRTARGSAAVNVTFNSWPAVTRIVASPAAVEAGETTTLTATVSDNDGDTLSYQWAADCAGNWTNGTSATARFTPSEQPATGTCARCRLTVSVLDGRGGRATGTLSICVGPRTAARFPPEIVHTFQSRASVPANGTATFRVEAQDPQASALTFTWRANMGTLGTPEQTATTSQVVWTAPECVLAGTTPAIQLTVTNALGLSNTTQFTAPGAPNCNGMSCEEGRVDCGGVCSDLSTDTAHCGACNQPCRSGEACQAGTCACAEGMVDCVDSCANLDSDPRHCGACGRACPQGANCNGGRCVASCAEGQTSCEGLCRDLRSDPANCGACGLACGTGATCNNGVCQCAPGEELCDGTCRATQSDPTNCGACGVTCRSDQTCSAGRCACPAGTTACGGRCVDTSSDNLNCGACGRTCSSTTTCVQGSCIQPFACQTNFTAPPADCNAFPLNLDRCGAAGAPFSVVRFDGTGDAPPRSILYPFTAAPNEMFTVRGIAHMTNSTVAEILLGYRAEEYPDDPILAVEYMFSGGGKQLFQRDFSSPSACARPAAFEMRTTRGAFTYDIQLERTLLSGNHNTGGATWETATPLAVGSNGRTCDQVCGRITELCATREDQRQYYRLTLPPRGSAIFEAALQAHSSSGSDVTLRAFQSNGNTICNPIDRLTGTSTQFVRGRLINNTLEPQEVTLMMTSSNPSTYNLSVAVEP